MDGRSGIGMPLRDRDELTDVARLCRENFPGISSVSVALVSRLGNRLFFFELNTEDVSMHTHIGSLPLTETGAGLAVLNSDTVCCKDLSESCLQYQDWRHFRQIGALTVLSVPLITSGRVLGTLNLASREAGSLKRNDPVLTEQAGIITPILAQWCEQSRKRAEEALRCRFLPQHLRSDAAATAATADMPCPVTTILLTQPSALRQAHAATAEPHSPAAARQLPATGATMAGTRAAIAVVSDDTCCSQVGAEGAEICSAGKSKGIGEFAMPGAQFASKTMEAVFLRWVVSGYQISVDLSFCCITLCCFAALESSWIIQVIVALAFAAVAAAALLMPEAVYCQYRECAMAGVRFVRTAVWCLEAQRMASDPAASEHTTNSLYISGTLVLLLEAFGCQMRLHKHLVVQSLNLAVVLAVSLRLAEHAGVHTLATCLAVQLGLGLLLPSLVLLSVEQSLRRRFLQSQCTVGCCSDSQEQSGLYKVG